MDLGTAAISLAPTRDIETVLAGSGLWQGLDAEAAAALTDTVHLVHIDRGQSIYRQGEPGDQRYIIVTGKVKIGVRYLDGRENLMAVLGPSDIFGILTIFDPGPRTESASALTPVLVAIMTREALQEWINGRPLIGERMLGMLARRLRRSNDQVSDLVFTDVPGRVAKCLLGMARRFGRQDRDGMHVTDDLTQAEIAQLVGARRETVNKALADFAQRGWITSKGKSVLIHQPGRLARRAH
jgi:CRP/FNR family cyclic AMP-dependent transcriptional regulator